MFYGIDLHSDSFKVAALDKDSDQTRVFQVSLAPEPLGKFLAKLTPDDYVAVEASTNTFWFTDQLDGLVKQYFVINPLKFSIIGNSSKKTDKVDAIKLAKKMKYFVLYDQSADEFPVVSIPPKEVRNIRSLFSSYELVKKERNMTKNRIHGLLKQYGLIRFKNKDLSLHHIRREILESAFNPVLKLQLEVFIQQLEELDEKKDYLQRMIISQGRIFDREIRLLVSIKGISPFLAIAIMADIIDINRFPNAKHLCSYLRTAPRIDASGDKARVGKINKNSRTLTLSLMTESLIHFVNSSDALSNFYRNKKLGKSAGKVRVAVIRKVLVAIFHMLKNNQVYYYTDNRNYTNKIKEYERVISKAA